MDYKLKTTLPKQIFSNKANTYLHIQKIKVEVKEQWCNFLLLEYNIVLTFIGDTATRAVGTRPKNSQQTYKWKSIKLAVGKHK